ncbi:NAD-dependent epimerase/dehydratase family protein [Aquirufa antheringensis]|uniref:NAD-dependent epimerase/dehydratase family protein n=1 Tax=Aquirufa antheringensis TaxID=2516559 RepID=UPI0022A987A9|nr:NAD-dependent epimerase/dehydratase family protein [Aquirufa antheringensis]MCZ2484719.1 NAD-dependent epimerase/dehydratase family protein [Aquirufa antheringensis]
MRKILVTGAGGLIGSEVVRFFCKKGIEVVGIDNNMRQVFFGDKGDTTWNISKLEKENARFKNYTIDIRDRETVSKFILEIKPDAIVHTAAQPSHDLAASMPFEDFDVNAVGTLNLLEATRRYNTSVPFVHLSTNKVYGDNPNFLELTEGETRYDYADSKYFNGISETFSIDQCKHSLFGASKVASDILVQEYGRYFNMPTCCLRGGCLTGPNHSGVELHGFLSYLIKCNLNEIEYKIYGYKGKQVRDNIHSYDVARFIDLFIQNPKVAAVYNIGGGRDNSISILEAFQLIESISGKPMKYTYVDENRIGDHICYISDLNKIKTDYPSWGITKDLQTTFQEIHDSWSKKGQV